jgi:hypothetical protein
MFCTGPSSCQRALCYNFLETGQMKFVVSLFLSEEEIKEIVGHNTMPVIDEDVDTSLIEVAADEPEADTEESFDVDAIELVEISGGPFC